MRIAINGMGRIGRLLFRRLIEDAEIEIVAINDTMPADNLAYLLKFDSIYGTLKHPIITEENTFKIGAKKMNVLQVADPANLPWHALKVEVVLECSGIFKDRENAAKHLAAGAGKVLLSTTSSDDIELKVYGHNQESTWGR